MAAQEEKKVTVREAGKGVVTSGWGTYHIGFMGDDETVFTAYNRKELEEFWRDFCKDNGFPTNSIDYIEKEW